MCKKLKRKSQFKEQFHPASGEAVSSNSLLDCPFCGSDAEFELNPQWKTLHVRCASNCVIMPTRPNCGYTTYEHAIEAWNHRQSNRGKSGKHV